MMLNYTVATNEGLVDFGNGIRGNFVQPLTVSFDCDMFWYDSARNISFLGRGGGRAPLTQDQIHEIIALVPTISL